MFGFLRIARTRLSKRDRDLYQAHYCAACHSMAEFSGRLCSFLTNYDQTFLLVVFSALDACGGEAPRKAGCTAIPFRRVSVQPVSPVARTLLAALNIALVEAKLRDDVADEARIGSRVALRLLSAQAERARATLRDAGFPVEVLAHLNGRQMAAESAETPSLLSLSSPTAEVLSEIFGFVAVVARSPQHEAASRRVGEGLARFIYVWDALEDVADDQAAGRFSALLATMGTSWNRERTRAFLLQWLEHTEMALGELPLTHRAPIAGHLLATLRSKIDAKLPAGSTERTRIVRAQTHSGASGWLNAVRLRTLARRGDCDCGGGCCCGNGCDCCDGGCCHSGGDCAAVCCRGVECCDCCICDCGNCGTDQGSGRGKSSGPLVLIGLVIIFVIILVVVWHINDRGPEPPPDTPAPVHSTAPTSPGSAPMASPSPAVGSPRPSRS